VARGLNCRPTDTEDLHAFMSPARHFAGRQSLLVALLACTSVAAVHRVHGAATSPSVRVEVGGAGAISGRLAVASQDGEGRRIGAGSGLPVAGPRSPEQLGLAAEARHLAEKVRAQAVIVTGNTELLLESLGLANRTAVLGDRLETQLAAIRSAALNASTSYQDYLAAVAAAKRRRDQLRNATEAAQFELSNLGAEYQRAEQEYQLLLFAMPRMQQLASETAVAEGMVGDQLRQTVEAGRTAEGSVASRAIGLQAALAEMLRLDGELRSMQERFLAPPQRLGARSPARPLAGLPLLALLAAAASAQHGLPQ